jgi:putative phosphoesterase
MKRIGLLSDTHSFLHPKTFDFFKDCHEIWHAGDIGSMDVLEKLENFKPTKAVFGNIDNHLLRAATSENLKFKCEELKVWITHIGGYPPNYSKSVRETLNKENFDLFICGHSHILKVMYDKKRELLHMNPGGAGKYGIHQVITLLRFEVNKNKIENLEIIELSKN